MIISMRFVNRILDLSEDLNRKSVFLFGPRQTGKTLLIHHTIQADRVYNLLDTDVLFRFSHRPARLREELPGNASLVVIDEIQKLPPLLDEVQLLMDTRSIRFLLTGSSARKLYRKGVNLLGGRARIRYLHPFSAWELKDEFDLTKALSVGTLPSIWFSDKPYEDLADYAGIYLREEIAAEALVRNIPAFSRFLTVAACTNAKILNYTNISSDAQVPASTIREYYHILKDTLIGYELPAWKESVKRKPLSTSKFFFFDIGVVNFLRQRKQVSVASADGGEAFETLVHHELRTYTHYQGKGDLHYWRSTSGFEVDFILDHRVAIEVKAKNSIGSQDLKGLRALKEEERLSRYILVCLEPVPRRIDDIDILPYDVFIQMLWTHELIS